jgi:polyisoprenoid-binding protein YceI
MATTKWTADPMHSEVGFKVKHMMFTNVSGKFDNYDVTITTEEDDFKNAEVVFSADISSINTANADRDKHLRSADFFNVDENPKITFKGTLFGQPSGSYELSGDLTINGKARNVAFPVDFSGLMKDPWGNTKAALSFEGKINRKDWGLVWNAALETGGVLVSDEVRINVEVQLVKQ